MLMRRSHSLGAMTRLTLLAAVALALGLTACGSEEPEPEPEPATPREPAAARLPGPLVYSRGGGIGGGSYRVTLQPDGRGRLETAGGPTREVRVPLAELAEVARRLEAADLPSQPARFAPERPLPDAFGHRVVSGDEQVTVEDGADGVPPEVRALVGRLSALLDALRR